MQIKVLSFENNLIDLSVDELTCHIYFHEMNIDDFVNGNGVIKPDAWFTSDEFGVDEPDFFNRKYLFELNNVIENYFRGLINE